MQKKKQFTDEEIKSISELGDILRSIAERLIREGKARIEGGKIVFLDKEKDSK